MTPAQSPAGPLETRPDVLEVVVPVATVWTSPQAPRAVDGPAVLDRPDVGEWTASMDAQVRKGLGGRTLTQLLLGEAVKVLEERDEWVRVAALLQSSAQDRTGYPGWMRRAHLGSAVRQSVGVAAFVMGRSATCHVEHQEPAELSFGTGLWVDGLSEQRVHVLLPGGRRGTLRLDERVRLAHKRQAVTYGAEDLLKSARQFLGLHYLWGGTSAWGLDCSGLVHLVMRAHGVVVPRDACDQADARNLERVPLEAVEAGDLYFFARPGEPIFHVGFASRRVGADGVRWMLHAPEGGELIEDAPMAPHRLDTLVSAGRVRKPA